MARDFSPFSHRLKALAQRAGLPVEADKAHAEQPTDDSPAVVLPEPGAAAEITGQDDATWASVDDPQYTGAIDVIQAPIEITGETAAVSPAAEPAREDVIVASETPAASSSEYTGETEVIPAVDSPSASGGDQAADAPESEAVPSAKRSFGARVSALRNLKPKPAPAPVEPTAAPALVVDAETPPAVGTTTGAQAAVGPAPEVPFAAQEPDLPSKPTFAERAALRRRARALRARRDTGLVELGAIVLDQRRFGDASGGSLVRRRTDELCDLEAELSSLEVALDEERPTEAVAALGILRCTSCGTLLGPADAFCAACGTARDAGEPAPAPPVS